MSQPFFSIVVPTLNEASVLPNLLRDLSQQSFAAFEVHIVDGGSGDKTASLAQVWSKKDPRFKLHGTAQRNVSLQRNAGARESAGKWLLFLDADSRIPIHFLQELKAQVDKERCDGFTCYAIADTEDLGSVFYIRLQNVLLELMARFGVPYSVGACMGCTRTVFKEIGGFDSRIAHMEDSELAKRLHQRGYQFVVLRSPRYIFSLRRQRKEGKLAMMAKLFPYYFKSLVKNEFQTPPALYPMRGGSDKQESVKS